MIDYFKNFSNHMTKLARVPKAVKQYRRALIELRNNKNLFHGTKPDNVAGLLDEGVVGVNPGTHGKGAYFWKNQPRSTYMRYPEYPGLFTKKKGVTLGKEPIDPHPFGTATFKGVQSDRPFMAISSTPVALAKGKDTTFVITPEQLKAGVKQLKDKKYRQMDTRIFHRAEVDRAMRAFDPDELKEPTKRELIRLLRGKGPERLLGQSVSGKKGVGMTRRRPTVKRDINNFYGQYDEAVGRKPILKDYKVDNRRESIYDYV